MAHAGGRPADLLVCVETKDAQSIEIHQSDNLRWMSFGDKAVQSVIDLQEPTRLVLPYTEAMTAALLFNPLPQRILNLGLGGGSFERLFLQKLPDASLTSVESSREVIGLSRQYFLLPADYAVEVATAQQFLAASDDTFDLILCDLHEKGMPAPCLYQDEFYRDALAALSDCGVMAINLLPASESDLMNVLLALRHHFDWTLLLDFVDYRNIVIFLLSQPPPDRELLWERAHDLETLLDVDLDDIPRRLRPLPLPERL
jgi:spermidine synthase